MSRAIHFVETDPEPGFGYTPAHREFFALLRRARIDKGLSIADMSDEVGLSFKLAYEFETLVTPLPFEWLEVWCKVVGVPFADYLVVYWDGQEVYFQKQEKEREAEETEAAREREGTPNAHSSTNTAAETTAPANASENRAFGLLAPLCAAFARVAVFFRALFSTPRETPE